MCTVKVVSKKQSTHQVDLRSHLTSFAQEVDWVVCFQEGRQRETVKERQITVCVSLCLHIRFGHLVSHFQVKSMVAMMKQRLQTSSSLCYHTMDMPLVSWQELARSRL